MLGCGLFIAAIYLTQASGTQAEPPRPFGPTPSDRQLKWHATEFYGMIHFGVNTFIDQEWSYGDAQPGLFNPTEFNAVSIVHALKETGLKGIVLVCKHHDGFCLWPSRYTDYSVKSSPWRNGHGDLVREISDACRNEGLKFGVYLSPWDRHSADYGRPEYITRYREELSELLTNYGPVFVAWFDGAQGGDGYYGGSREIRRVDNRSYYDWPTTWAIVRKLQPIAVIFSDAGPDVRWVGNEHGAASDPSWNTLNLKDCFPGMPNYQGLGSGLRSGPDWVPPECDVSIRPGWFYHSKEDSWVKSAQRLLDIYYHTVGLGACLNLNVPLDKSGRIPDKDAEQLREMGRRLHATFSVNLARDARVSASNVRGQSRLFGAENLINGDRNLYWTTDNEVETPNVILDFGAPTTFNVIRIREYLPLGQRVEAFSVDAWQDSGWAEFSQGFTIGNERLVRIKGPITSSKIRVRIIRSAACPALSELGVFLEPAAPNQKVSDKATALSHN